LQPARRVYERPVFFGEACSGKAVHLRLDRLGFFGRYAGGSPEVAGFFGINVADDQELGFLERIDILLRIGTDSDAIHAEGEQAFDFSFVHVVPDVGPGIFPIDFRQVIEGPTILLVGSGAV